MHAQSLSHIQFFSTPWTIVLQAPLSMGFPRQEYWSRLPFPSLGDLPVLRIKPISLSTVPRIATTTKNNQNNKKIKRKNIHWKNWYWNSNTLAIWSKSQLIGKDPDTGKDWGQEEKGTAEDEMVGWHHRLDGHESEQTLGDGEGQEAWHAAVHGVTIRRMQLCD